jgi:hypothetical protein
MLPEEALRQGEPAPSNHLFFRNVETCATCKMCVVLPASSSRLSIATAIAMKRSVAGEFDLSSEIAFSDDHAMKNGNFLEKRVTNGQFHEI